MESTSGHIGLEANHEITGEPLFIPSYNFASCVIIHLLFALWKYYSYFAISVISSKQSARITPKSLVLRIIEPTIYATCQFFHSCSHYPIHISCCNIIICNRNMKKNNFSVCKRKFLRHCSRIFIVLRQTIRHFRRVEEGRRREFIFTLDGRPSITKFLGLFSPSDA